MENSIRQCLPTYQIVGKIGEGVYGCVYQVKDPFKQRAVKVVPFIAEGSSLYPEQYDLDTKLSHDFHAVREYYQQIKGPGVIEVYDFHLVQKQTSRRVVQANVVILMELCRENLRDHILDRFPLPFENIRTFAATLTKTLERLSRGKDAFYLITDLKPANLLITSHGELVIGDLGGFKRVSSASTTTSAQFSPDWTAPELVLQAQRPSVKSVIYSMGLLMYFMCEGCLPYAGQPFVERIRLIKEKGISFKRENMPDDLSRAIRHCLEFDPEKRPESFEKIFAIMPGSALGSVPKQQNPIIENADFQNRNAPAKERVNTSTTVSDTWKDPITGLSFKHIPGGTFTMGAGPHDPHAAANEKPAREVTVKPFWMGIFPVTQSQWLHIMKNNPARFRNGGEYPVEQVSWKNARQFVRKLNLLNREGISFHLPTEEQWEFAACGGFSSPDVPFAGSRLPDRAAWHSGNSCGSTHPVGSLEPNALGLYDMCGNVQEWCENVYMPYDGDPSCYKESTSAVWDRVCRGGAWNTPPVKCRNTARKRFPPQLTYANTGFRVVCHLT